MSASCAGVALAAQASNSGRAVFLRDMSDQFAEMYRLADLSTDLIDETGEFVHAMPYHAGAYNERTPLMLGVRTDGIDL